MTNFNSFYDLLNLNMPVVYFLYGLTFFTSGIVILVQYRQSSPFSFNKDIWLLSLFGIFHGLSEWGYLFIPLQQAYFEQKIIFLMYAVRSFFSAFSFIVLLSFGLRVLAITRIKLLDEVISYGFFATWFGFSLVNLRFGDMQSLLLGDTVTHYFLGMTSIFITSLALFRQAKYGHKHLAAPEILRSERALAISFFFYAFFEGIIVSQQDFFPANLINSSWFFHITKLPVQIFRTLCGIFILYYTLKLMGAFQRATDNLFLQAKEEALRLAERERISRDLHDGVLQTLYAAELMIESCQYKLEPTSPVQAEMQKSIKTLDVAMHDLRSYIMGIKNEAIYQQPLALMLKNISDEFQNSYQITVNFNYLTDPNLQLTPNRQNHLYHIITELFNNVTKHAKAKHVAMHVKDRRHQLYITFTDDGIGLPKECLEPAGCNGLGLRHIHERMMILQGEISFDLPLQGGTLVVLAIPLA
ncbi:MAG: sensor histidine kinase [Desulfitobacteriaceae bacterium]